MSNEENVIAMKPTASVVVVTPDVASRWIGKNAKNRNIRSSVVSAYARDMKGGNWVLTGEAVKFDRTGDLIYGQHRLMAIIKSGVSVPMFVIRGLASDAQDVMDSGSKRSAADALHLNGHKNATMVASAARLALALEYGDDVKSKSFTHSEIVEWVTENPEIETAAAAANALRSFVDLAPSVVALTWLMFHHIDSDACADFWESIGNSATDGPGDPRNTLIRRLSAARRGGERLSQSTQVAFVVRAWNAWRKGDQLHVLKVRSSNGKGGATRVSIPKAV